MKSVVLLIFCTIFTICGMIDRYLQKKRDIKENERKAAQEKEIYEAEQRRRFARVCRQKPVYEYRIF